MIRHTRDGGAVETPSKPTTALREEALRFGDPEEFMEYSRPRWESWNMPEDRAREIAQALCDPASASGLVSYAAQYGHCNDDLVPAPTVLPS